MLADPQLAPALAALRSARPKDAVRVACMVELGDVEQTEATAGHIKKARAALARHEIALDVWPQLAGPRRFLNTSTAQQFQERLLPLLDALEGSDVGLALDLEPSEQLAKAAWTLRDDTATPWRRVRALASAAGTMAKSVLDARQGRRDLAELARDLQARDIPVHVAVLPPLAATASDALRAWALGCPVVDVDGKPLFGLQAAMCYAPMSRKLPRRAQRGRTAREHEKHTLALWAARHRVSFDAVVVGQTATGILGDEPVYDDPAVFAEDVRAMEALAYRDVAVYALEGMLFGATGVPDAKLTLRTDVDRWIGAAFGEHRDPPRQH